MIVRDDPIEVGGRSWETQAAAWLRVAKGRVARIVGSPLFLPRMRSQAIRKAGDVRDVDSEARGSGEGFAMVDPVHA